MAEMWQKIGYLGERVADKKEDLGIRLRLEIVKKV